MGGSDLECAGQGAEKEHVPARGRAAARVRRALLALTVLAGALALCPPAFAAPGEVHTLVGQIKPSGVCKFEEPTLTAVSAKTGEVFVYNRANNYLDRFGPAAGSTPTKPAYECLGRHRAGKAEVGEEGNEGLTVDNSPTSPAYGMVYLVAPEEHQILKFNSEFKEIGHIKKIKAKFIIEGFEEPFEQEEFESIFGLATDTAGELFVDVTGEHVFRFNSEANNKLLALPQEMPFFACSPRPGFAVSPDGKRYYVGTERINHEDGCEEPTTIAEVLASTGEPELAAEFFDLAQLDNAPNSGVAVDELDSHVFFGNVTNISEFASQEAPHILGAEQLPRPPFIERFGSLEHNAGVAVDPQTGQVFATDAQKDVPETGEGLIDVYAETPVQGIKPEEAKTAPADERHYELVTPPNKHGQALYAYEDGGILRAAANGEAITYTSSGPIVPEPAASRAPEPSTNFSRRGPEGWQTQDLGTPRTANPTGAGTGVEYKFFTEDLSQAFVDPARGLPEPNEVKLSPEATEATSYRRTTQTGEHECLPVPSTCYQALVYPGSPGNPGDDLTGNPFGQRSTFLYATPDGRHAILTSEVNLTNEGPPIAPGNFALYEWEYIAPGPGEAPRGALKLVSVAPPKEESAADVPLLGDDDAIKNLGFPASMRSPISEDGSRVVWSGTERQLYVRDTSTNETLRVDAAEEGEEPSQAEAEFQIASADGKRIFFTDQQRLKKDATAREPIEEVTGQGETQQDLYACELGEPGTKLGCKGGLTNLTAGVTAENESAQVQGVIGASKDGSTIYFVADGVLAPGAGHGRCGSSSEEFEPYRVLLTCNLYVDHRGAGGWEAPRFIARVTGQDFHDWSQKGPETSLTSRVSTSGQYMTFMSNSELTGYNNVDASAAAKGERDEEVYLYNGATNQLTCVSCSPNPAAGKPSGLFEATGGHEVERRVLGDFSQIWRGRWLAANVSGWNGASEDYGEFLSRSLSDEGRLFFNSYVPLVPADTNEVADVYEFEPKGVGTCKSSTGCISLVSTGKSPQESAFMEASTSGDNAFIMTSEQLSPILDKDSAFDIYDAHLCSQASPCVTPQIPPQPPCEVEPSEANCKGPSGSVPAAPPVTPSTQPGSGNAGTFTKESGSVLSSSTKKTAKPTNAQLLAKALKECKKKKNKAKRKACEKAAHKKYPTSKKSTKKKSVKKGTSNVKGKK
jgi:hypothetical protein